MLSSFYKKKKLKMNLYQKLRWLMLSGITETVGEEPVNRLKNKEQSTITVVEPVVSTPQKATILFRPEGMSVSQDSILKQAVTQAALATDINSLRHILSDFNASPLKKTAAHTVFCAGNPSADIMIIGDVPEAGDDLAGQPFTGEVGALLTRMMGAIDLDLNTHCYMTTLIPWRTPGGRKPTSAETAHCLPFLKRHIELVQPKFLLLFGALTTGALLGIDSIPRARGSWHAYQSENLSAPIACLATFAPAYLLKNPIHRKHVWEDLKRLQAKLGESDNA